MYKQVIRALTLACLMALSRQAVPAVEPVLFANHNPGAPSAGASQAAATTSIFPKSLVNQKAILVHLGNNQEVKIKKRQLSSPPGACDIAAQVADATWSHGKVRLLLDNIGDPQPHMAGCKMSYHKVTVEISGFKGDEPPESLDASVAQILKTPEQYLASHGIIFNLPPGPDDEQPVKDQSQLINAKPQLMIDANFSEQASRSKYQGSVGVNVVIGTDGRIHRPKITRGGEMGLGEAALRVLSMWRFEPARQGGKPVAVQTYLEMTFQLF